ncbi:hypothetical protein [Aquihabitans sp. McL0605]
MLAIGSLVVAAAANDTSGSDTAVLVIGVIVVTIIGVYVAARMKRRS